MLGITQDPEKSNVAETVSNLPANCNFGILGRAVDAEVGEQEAQA